MTAKRAGIGIGLLGGALLLYLLAGWFLTQWLNDRDMDRWTGEITAASEIEGTAIVEIGSRFGNQPGTNGNHCDREAWIVYDTDLSSSEIKDHFDMTLQPGPDLGPGSARVSEIEGDLMRVDFWFRFETGFKAKDPRCF